MNFHDIDDDLNPGILAMREMQAQSVRNGNSNMTLDEINTEIEAVRREQAVKNKLVQFPLEI